MIERKNVNYFITIDENYEQFYFNNFNCVRLKPTKI